MPSTIFIQMSSRINNESEFCSYSLLMGKKISNKLAKEYNKWSHVKNAAFTKQLPIYLDYFRSGKIFLNFKIWFEKQICVLILHMVWKKVWLILKYWNTEKLYNCGLSRNHSINNPKTFFEIMDNLWEWYFFLPP